MAVSKPAGLIDIWNVGEEAPRRTLALEAGGVSLSLAVSSGRELLLSGTNLGTLAIWSLSDGKTIKTVKLSEGELFGVLAVTPGGDLAVAKSGYDLALVTMPEGQVVGQLSPYQVTTSTAAVSSDGRRLATGSVHGEVDLWDLKSGLMVGCLVDPAATMEGTAVSQGRAMGLETRAAPCGTPLPPGATCLCDCVAANRSYETSTAICTCDTISVPAGYMGAVQPRLRRGLFWARNSSSGAPWPDRRPGRAPSGAPTRPFRRTLRQTPLNVGTGGPTGRLAVGKSGLFHI